MYMCILYTRHTGKSKKKKVKTKANQKNKVKPALDGVHVCKKTSSGTLITRGKNWHVL